jgi:DNA-directed RNA polymerase
MKADKPFSFLSAIIELMNIENFDGDVENYICSLPIFIDGTNNGVQHMAAMLRDEETAPLVNLVPQELPGDVYMSVCDAVYKELEAVYEPELDGEFQVFYEGLMKLVDEVQSSGFGQGPTYADVKAYEEEHNSQRFAPNFFMSITEKSKRRKLVKRPVMTLGYGATKAGFTQMILDDTKGFSSKFRAMPIQWARMFGDLIYKTCRGPAGKPEEAVLPSLAIFLDLISDVAQMKVADGDKMRWTNVITGFPIVQSYVKGRAARGKITMASMGGTVIQISFTDNTSKVIDKRKQKAAAAPNFTHSNDAAHVTMVIDASEFRVCTIHDSFGSAPGDMGKLFRVSRETFADLYDADPLRAFMDEQGLSEMMPAQGNLDIEAILQSDFAFS